MLKKILVMTGAGLNVAWGVAHLFPTISVVQGFGNISLDNQRIILMEWINEGFTLIFIGLLVFFMTVMNKENSRATRMVYIAAAIMLFSMAVLSLFTGFKIDFLPFKLCPLIFAGTGLLILQGSFKKSRED